MHGQSGFRIDAMTRFDHVVLHVAADSVLWSKQRAEFYVGMVVQEIGGVMVRMVNGCLVANQSHPRTSNRGVTFLK
jgi:hypothetical protein